MPCTQLYWMPIGSEPEDNLIWLRTVFSLYLEVHVTFRLGCLSIIAFAATYALDRQKWDDSPHCVDRTECKLPTGEFSPSLALKSPPIKHYVAYLGFINRIL